MSVKQEQHFPLDITVTEVTFRRNLICLYPSIFYKVVVRLTEFVLSVLNFTKVMSKQENRKKVGGNTNYEQLNLWESSGVFTLGS